MKAIKIYLAGLILLIFLASCSLRPSQLGQRATTPLPDTPTPTLTSIPSITPIPQPTRRATFVPIPSSTRGPSITPHPTITPLSPDQLLAIQAEITKSRYNTGLGPYQCKIISTEPEELEVIRPREEFPGIWRILNKGKAAWVTDDIAYFYISGTRFQTTKYKESFIPYIVNPKDQLNLRVPMRAPAEPGIYFAIWGLRIKSEAQFFCTFAITITVEEK